MKKLLMSVLALGSLSVVAQMSDFPSYGQEYQQSNLVKNVVSKVEGDYEVRCEEGSVSGVRGAGIRSLSFRTKCFNSKTSKGIDLKVNARYSGQLESLKFDLKKIQVKF